MKFRVAPHTLFFLIITLLYGVPHLLTLFFDLNEQQPYVSNIILSDFKDVRWDVFIVYIVSVSTFLFGTGLISAVMRRIFIENNIDIPIEKYIRSLKRLNIFQGIVIYGIICIGIFLLIKMYRAGSFNSNYMDSFNQGYEAQNLFTVFCDIFLFLFIYLWFNYRDSYKWTKFLLCALILVTVLKGSRMFTIPLIFIVIYKFVYFDKLTSKRFILLVFGGIFSLIGLFSIFFFRHNSQLNSETAISTLLLLVQYETCGVHIPLMKAIQLDWNAVINPFYYLFSDLFLFLIPRFVLPVKNDFLYFDKVMIEYQLSPFGGTNGESSILIYFGVLYPFAFMMIGILLSYLYNVSKISKYKYLTPLYIFVCCSLIFTFLRNGVLISIKNFILITVIFSIILIGKRIKIGNLK